MKIIIFLFSLFFSCYSLASNIIVNGTRFIYPGNEKEITIQMSNTADRPAIAQSWLDDGNPDETPDTIKTPFQITPPIARIEAKGGQVLRIKLMDKAGLPTDRESIWWLNILDIPAISKKNGKDDNTLQLAIRSRFKFIYRPANLGSAQNAINNLLITAKGSQLYFENKTPFYLTVTKVATNDSVALNSKTLTIAPYATEVVSIKKSLKPGTSLLLNSLNDFGANVKSTIILK